MHLPMRKRCDRPVVNILERRCTGPWITRILVDRGKADLLMTTDDCLSPIPMVRIEVPDRDLTAPNRQCPQGGDCNRIKIAETHRLIGGGVMTCWPNE